MDYIINLLSKTISKERKNLEFWQQNLNSADPMIARQAHGSINSNESRLKEAEEALEIIIAHKKRSNQRTWSWVGTMIELTEEGQRTIDRANKQKQQQFKNNINITK